MTVPRTEPRRSRSATRAGSCYAAAVLPHAVLLVLAGWAIVWATCAGLGALLRTALRAPARTGVAWLDCFWLGWAVAVFLLQLWHLVLPVDERASMLLVGLGALGLVSSGLAPWRAFARGVRRAWPAMLSFAGALWWLADRALGGPRNGDSGLYHVPTIRWFSELPIVVGLANLYGPFALNHSYLLYAAALDVGPFADRSYHLANSVLVTALVARVLLALWTLVARRASTIEDLYWTLLLPVAVTLVLDLNYTSPSPDLPVIVLGLVLTAHLIRIVTASRARPAPAIDLIALLLLVAVGVTVKLSLGGLGAASVGVALLAWVRHPRARVGPVIVGGLLGALGVVPWLVRGVLQSGYPFFPTIAGGLPVPWRVPPEATTWILGIHQMAGSYVLAFRDPAWFYTWLQTFGWTEPAIVVPLALALAMAVVAVVVRVASRRPFALSPLVLLAPLAQVAFLFVMAPRARYGGAAFVLLAVECTCLALGGAIQRGLVAARVLAVAGALGLAMLPLHSAEEPLLRELRDFEPSARSPLVAIPLESGLVVQYPGPSESCWNAPLPCTPAPNHAVRLRRPGELASGFAYDPAIAPRSAIPAPP